VEGLECLWLSGDVPYYPKCESKVYFSTQFYFCFFFFFQDSITCQDVLNPDRCNGLSLNEIKCVWDSAKKICSEEKKPDGDNNKKSQSSFPVWIIIVIIVVVILAVVSVIVIVMFIKKKNSNEKDVKVCYVNI
jgi:hypothetical protein